MGASCYGKHHLPAQLGFPYPPFLEGLHNQDHLPTQCFILIKQANIYMYVNIYIHKFTQRHTHTKHIVDTCSCTHSQQFSHIGLSKSTAWLSLVGGPANPAQIRTGSLKLASLDSSGKKVRRSLIALRRTVMIMQKGEGTKMLRQGLPTCSYVQGKVISILRRSGLHSTKFQ